MLCKVASGAIWSQLTIETLTRPNRFPFPSTHCFLVAPNEDILLLQHNWRLNCLTTRLPVGENMTSAHSTTFDLFSLIAVVTFPLTACSHWSTSNTDANRSCQNPNSGDIFCAWIPPYHSQLMAVTELFRKLCWWEQIISHFEVRPSLLVNWDIFEEVRVAVVDWRLPVDSVIGRLWLIMRL